MSTVSKSVFTKTEVIYLRRKKNYCGQIKKKGILQLFFQHLTHQRILCFFSPFFCFDTVGLLICFQTLCEMSVKKKKKKNKKKKKKKTKQNNNNNPLKENRNCCIRQIRSATRQQPCFPPHAITEVSHRISLFSLAIS